MQFSTLNNKYSIRVIRLFVLPLLIYILSTFGDAFHLPVFIVGSLVLLKSIIDLKSIRRPVQEKRQHTSRAAVRQHCYLCKREAELTPYPVSGKRMAVCDRCHACISHSSQYDRGWY
jgi:hypothetical protein